MFCGHPTYKPEFVEQVIDMFRDGSSKTQVAAKFGVSKTSYKNWIEKYPEFAEAAAIGETIAQAFQEDRQNKCIENPKDYNAKAQEFLLISRYRDDYCVTKQDDQKEALMQALVTTINDKAAKKEQDV